jgi:hypothetical protein
MKKLIKHLLLMIALVSLTSCFYTNSIAGVQKTTYVENYAAGDTLSHAQISIRLGTSSTYNYTGQPISQNTLGTPNSIDAYDFEMLDTIGSVYNYTGAKVYYANGKMYTFVVTGSAWSIGKTGGPYIKVGANISTLAALLPNYNSNKVDGTISATISNNGTLTDSFLYIQFDPSTSIITKISLHDY